MTALDRDHAARMDGVYRRQRRVYDLTRAWYLLGRDRLIDGLAPPPGGSVLEIACGTGRNLDLIGRRHPDQRLHGLDISAQMLATARAKLRHRAWLARADACAFDPRALFDEPGIDRVILSYSVSMIPDWRGALAAALAATAPGGQIHVVDFGSQDRLPRWFRRGLRAWLARFHVTPRDDLRAELERLAETSGATLAWESLHRGYAQRAVLIRT
jgi:S-adenosylmethionine-diacylgycerolhomoserine-N-methlytransferase